MEKRFDASGTFGAGRLGWLGWLVGLGASFGEYEGRPTVGGPPPPAAARGVVVGSKHGKAGEQPPREYTATQI